MAALNVNRSIRDPSYRYKMAAIQVDVQRIPKTSRLMSVLTNLKAVAKALGCQPDMLLKFLAIEAGISSKIQTEKVKGQVRESYVLLGRVEPGKLQSKLDGFIQTWVLCRVCEIPETCLFAGSAKKNDANDKNDKNRARKKKRAEAEMELFQRCYACGNLSNLKTDSSKFFKFLLAAVPAEEPPAPKKYQKFIENEPVEAATSGEDSPDGWGENDDYLLDSSEQAAVERAFAMIRDATAGSISKTQNVADMKKFSVSVRCEVFLKHCRSLIEKYGESYCDDILALKELKFLVKSFKLYGDGVAAYAHAVLKWKRKMTAVQFLGEIEKFGWVLRILCAYREERCQMRLLAVVENVMSKNRKCMLSGANQLIFALYDKDIVDEEVVVEWAGEDCDSNSFKGRVVKECEKLIAWLGDDGESESEESEVLEKEESDGEESDIDIDAI